MKLILAVLGVIGFSAAISGPASSQAAGLANDSCPTGPVSIYFADGDILASPQSQAVLGKVRETARECLPELIDLIVHLDARSGAGAKTVALERLAMVADELVASGLPAAQIRIVADTTNAQDSKGLAARQIEIVFRKTHAHQPEEISEPLPDEAVEI